MNFRALLATSLLLIAPVAAFSAETKPAEKSAASARHPLRGVITSVMADQSAFMVKHEEIPGVMRAMTMMFKVDEATFKAFKAGDAITGLMSRQGRNWVLENVKPAAAKPAK
ncbi:MAG: copper-binding protein [Opitutaceae bacterium]|nr:copper-binding protein [Opitutaceae bacterium]